MSYFDPIRKKNVPSTPEESVRQSVLHFLKNNLKVPEHLIEVEFSLTNIQKTNRDRVDILVHQFRNSKNIRSEEHTSELQSRPHLVCRLLLEKKKKKKKNK